jgi:hypothetical protein
MSAETKRSFDVGFKIFLGLLFSFFGWLGVRFVEKVDQVEASFYKIEVSHGELKKDMEWVKQTLRDIKNETK